MIVYEIGSSSKIDEHNCTITGVRILKGDEMVESSSIYPLPHVAYDYTFLTKASKKRRDSYWSLKEQLGDLGCKFLVPRGKSKLVNDKLLFSSIMNEAGIRHPETVEMSEENLIAMIQRHRALYLKPVRGQAGRGIIVVSKEDDCRTGYKLEYMTYEQSSQRWHRQQVRYVTDENLYDEWKRAKFETHTKLKHPRKSGKPRPSGKYLIQEAIDAYEFDGDRCHFRVITQRGLGGVLTPPLLAAYLGGNSSQSGTVDNYELVTLGLERDHGVPSTQTISNLKKTAQDVHSAIEDVGQVQMGELGMDLAVDREGNVHVIEANVKPGQLYFYMKRGKLVIRDCDFRDPGFIPLASEMQYQREKNLAHYAEYLAQQG